MRPRYPDLGLSPHRDDHLLHRCDQTLRLRLALQPEESGPQPGDGQPGAHPGQNAPGKWEISAQASFFMRKHYFNNEENGVLKAGTKKQSAPPNPMTDPSMMTEMLKGNLTSMVPMVVVGGWINWHFSGFVTTKVPFPLTLRFKGMLQRGIELQSL